MDNISLLIRVMSRMTMFFETIINLSNCSYNNENQVSLEITSIIFVTKNFTVL